MKKVLIIQNDASTSGGVWSVNKTLASSLVKDGFMVNILAIRDKFKETEIKNLDAYSVFPNKKWSVPTSENVKKSLKSFKFIKAFIQIIKNLDRRIDIINCRNHIRAFDPDYIICSHYQALSAIPCKYLKNTMHVHHNSYANLVSCKANYNTLKKYNGRINFCWLSENIMNEAKKDGFKKCYFVYNPVKFETDELADVVNNKKLIAISRIVPEKRIELMVDIVNDIFKSKKYDDWSLEIYGDGVSLNDVKDKIKDMDRIKLFDRTSAVEETFLSSSINLNTSSYEGFPMNILEASECGVPTITFNYGEAVSEQVVDGETGFIIKQDDIKSFKNKLIMLMENTSKLKEFSKNTKDYNKKFSKENNLESWKNLFDKINK